MSMAPGGFHGTQELHVGIPDWPPSVFLAIKLWSLAKVTGVPRGEKEEGWQEI